MIYYNPPDLRYIQTPGRIDTLLYMIAYKGFVWEIGDWLIHEQYGIGRHAGVRKIVANGVLCECIGIQYSANSVVWTPTVRMSQIGYFAHKSKKVKAGKRVLQKIEQFRADARQWFDFFVSQESARTATNVTPMNIYSNRSSSSKAYG